MSEPAEVRRTLQARAVDWLVGGVAMLLVLALSAGVFWMVVSRPADEGAAGPTDTSTLAPDPTRVPAVTPTPPPGLTDDQVWLGDVALDSVSLVAAGTPLLDVAARGRDVTSGQDGITAAWVRLTGTVPFHVVATELGPDTLVDAADGDDAMVEGGDDAGDEVRVVRRVELLGRVLDVVATGTVDVVDGRLVMEPTSVDVDGGGLLSAVLTGLARTFVTIEHEIEGLPEGLVLQHVAIVDDGFRATLEGADVVLTQQP